MENMPIEKMLKVTDYSLYKLVTLVSKRAIEIAEGSPRLCETKLAVKPATVAFYEILEGKVSCKKPEKAKVETKEKVKAKIETKTKAKVETKEKSKPKAKIETKTKKKTKAK